ncbi:LysR family transcriptional regulator [Brevibacterium otitidis]|uniref:LysR family transcriptional regulator n=2 Tax=Brevibacterium otitidis TaxID=53364 RepID=A0ABV5X620_9MICO
MAMNWTLVQLRAFVAVAEFGSMSAAARALGYTPGAISQHMSSLRRIVGTDLLVAAGRGFTLTEAGRTLLERARAVIAAEEQAAEAVRGQDFGRFGAVTLGVFGSASVVAFAAAASRLTGSGVQAREIDVEHMPEAVLAGRIDVGIGIDYPAAPLAPQRGLRVKRVHSEEFSVVAPGGQAPTHEALAGASWILPPSRSLQGRAVRFAIAGLGFAPRETHIITDTTVALAMVRSGLGFTLGTPIMMALAPDGLHLVPGTEAGGRHIVVISREELADRPDITAVTDVLTEVFTSGAGIR